MTSLAPNDAGIQCFSFEILADARQDFHSEFVTFEPLLSLSVCQKSDLFLKQKDSTRCRLREGTWIGYHYGVFNFCLNKHFYLWYTIYQTEDPITKDTTHTEHSCLSIQSTSNTLYTEYILGVLRSTNQYAICCVSHNCSKIQ